MATVVRCGKIFVLSNFKFPDHLVHITKGPPRKSGLRAWFSSHSKVFANKCNTHADEIKEKGRMHMENVMCNRGWGGQGKGYHTMLLENMLLLVVDLMMMAMARDGEGKSVSF